MLLIRNHTRKWFPALESVKNWLWFPIMNDLAWRSARANMPQALAGPRAIAPRKIEAASIAAAWGMAFSAFLRDGWICVATR